jgi:DNA sulfur modification protein DndD
MIFQELTLENFGPYLGKQTIHLAPKSESQPIVLFGGMNGGGKTTLMDAFRLALYGQRALCSTRGNLSYPEFLSQCVNRQSDFASIELSFLQTINNAPTPTTFRIYRTWTRSPKGGRDTLQIFEDDYLKDDLTKDWDERIEGLLPLGISNLFLFDGEQVKELADQDTLPRFAIEAMRSLLGLELPDRLSADLDILANRKRKEVASRDQLKELDVIEATLKDQEDSRRQLKKQMASIQTKLDKQNIQPR